MVTYTFDTALAALAALYVWVLASQLHTPVIYPVQRWLRTGPLRSLVSCPWCSGFWLSVIAISFIQWGRLDIIGTPTAILASAAIVGIVGSNWTAGVIDDNE